MTTNRNLLLASLLSVVVTTHASDNGNQQTTLNDRLKEQQWQKRVLLINTDRLDTIPQIPTSLYHELKLHPLIINKYKLYLLSSMGDLKQVEVSDIASTRFNKQNQVWLVGLDGGVKANYLLNEFNVASMTELINTMPMRQWELESK